MSEQTAATNADVDREAPMRLPHFTGAVIAPLIEIQVDLAETPNSVKQNWITILLPYVPGSQELVMIGDHSYLCQGRRYLVGADGRSGAKVCILLVKMGGQNSLVQAPAAALTRLNGHRKVS